MAENGQRYVTYSWLIGACGGTLVAVITIVFFTIMYFERSMEQKVDNKVFAYFCSDLTSIKTVVDRNAIELTRQGKNQLLVLRALKIEPVRE
jgi:ATP/ADP translocase